MLIEKGLWWRWIWSGPLPEPPAAGTDLTPVCLSLTLHRASFSNNSISIQGGILSKCQRCHSPTQRPGHGSCCYSAPMASMSARRCRGGLLASLSSGVLLVRVRVCQGIFWSTAQKQEKEKPNRKTRQGVVSLGFRENPSLYGSRVIRKLF